MSRTYEGQLEVDPERGVVYFHSNEGRTLLRIGHLPTPVPRLPGDTGGEVVDMLDITFGDMVNGHKTSWEGTLWMNR